MDDGESFPQPSAENLSFDSASLPPVDRFPRYRALYAQGADAIEAGADFRAAVRGWRLDRAILYDRRLNDVMHERGVQRVARDGFDHFTLTLVLSGLFEMQADTRFRPVPPGGAVLVDMRHPMRNRLQDAHIVTVSLPRERLLAAAGTVEGLHGLILDPGQAALLCDYIQSLIRRIGDLTQPMLAPATQALTALLSVALSGQARVAADLIGSRPADDRVERVRSLIDRHLGDAALGPDMLVDKSGIARATLYRLFRAQGGLAAYIQRRRLDIVRMALTDPAERRSFAEIVHAVGLPSESHASRLFLETFGVRPGEYRASALPNQDDPKLSRRLGYWYGEMR